MPADLGALHTVLIEMKKIYSANSTAAVRSQKFIKVLHDYCAAELARAGFDPKYIKKEVTIFGSHKTKDVDVAYVHPNNGPLAIVNVRSQMSSVSKNLPGYFEGIIGDCISLHDRFPMAVVTYVYLLPANPIKTGLETEVVALDRAEKLFSLITNRGDWRNPKDKFEHFAFLKVDFSKDPPVLLNTIDDLKIDNLFDKIRATYSDRNFFL